MIDDKLGLKDEGAVTASGNGTGIEIGSGLVKARMLIHITAIEVGSDDEEYQLHLMGGDDASFTEAVSLACLQVGASGAIEDNVDSETGRYQLDVSNEKNGTIYPYVRVRHVIAGSISTGINYAAYLTER